MSRTSTFLTCLLAGAGTLHLVKPEPFEELIPDALPATPREWTVWSGWAELAVAGLLACPPTRKIGGRAAAALFVAVFPGNIKMAVDWSDRPALQKAIAYGRLPLQGVLVRQARRVAREG